MPDYAGGPINPGNVMAYATRPLPLPQSATKPIFSFYQGGLSGQGGWLEIIDLMGLVVVAPGAVANVTLLGAVVTGPLAKPPVGLCAGVDVNAAVAGSIYSITGTLAAAATLNANGVDLGMVTPIHVGFGANGQIIVQCAASDGLVGRVQWHLLARASYGVVVNPAVQ